MAQLLGNVVDWLGTKLNLPERGWSERIAGGATTRTGSTPYAQSWSQPRMLTPESTSSVGQNVLQKAGVGMINPLISSRNLPTSPGGQVLGTTKVGGGGGGGGGGTTSQTQQTQATSGPSEQDLLQAELDNIFNPVFSALQGQEETLRQNYAPVEGQITAQGELSKQTVGGQYETGAKQLTQEETGLGTRREDALTSATRLYNELQRGGQQRFGGASSAGEAFQTLTATEQQRRQGTIQGLYETGMQKVTDLKASLKQKYDLAVQEITLQTQQYIADAQTQFRDALQSIKSAVSMAQSDKATASMNALQDLRNRIYTINAQNLQFAQQLALNNEINLKTVDDYTAKIAQFGTQAGIVGTNFGTQAMNTAGTTSYGIGSTQTPTPTTPTGVTTGQWYKDKDGNWVQG